MEGDSSQRCQSESPPYTKQNSLIEISRLKGQGFDFMTICRTIKQRLQA
jgi:hypothetical protein